FSFCSSVSSIFLILYFISKLFILLNNKSFQGTKTKINYKTSKYLLYTTFKIKGGEKTNEETCNSCPDDTCTCYHNKRQIQ
ncbi:MAG: hypothetical protein ACE5J9_11230, partial [Methanosarcinales archaeon]